MELFAADGHDAGGCERVTGKSGMRPARVLERLAGSLERDHPGAAASIWEGLGETLSVQRLGLTGALQRTLRTTNRESATRSSTTNGTTPLLQTGRRSSG